MSANTRLSLATFAAGVCFLVVAAAGMFASPPPAHVSQSRPSFCAGPAWYPMPEVAHGGRAVDG